MRIVAQISLLIRICKCESANLTSQHASTCIKTQKRPAINQAARNQDAQQKQQLEKEEEQELEKVAVLQQWVAAMGHAGVHFDGYLLEAFSQLCFFKFEAAEHMVSRVLAAFSTVPVWDPTRYFKTAVTAERALHGLWR